MNCKRILKKDADYQKFEVLKTNRNKRYRYNEFFVEGVKNINEAIKNNWNITSFIYSFEEELCDWARNVVNTVKTSINYELPKALIDELSGKEDSSKLMAVVQMREDNLAMLSLSDNPLIALFDRPSNRGNLGTIIRSCEGLGVEALIITGHCVDLYDPDVVVSSMGSLFNLPVIRVADNETIEGFINTLREAYPTLKVVGTTAHAEQTLFDTDLTTPTLFMIGNETDGLCRKFSEISDTLVSIPMVKDACATSFNVACAATVMFAEAIRQRSTTAKATK